MQSAGSLGDDGQSVCELQAVLSVLSQLLFVIHLFCSLVSARREQHCLSLLPPSLDPAEHAGCVFGVLLSVCVLGLSIQKLRFVSLDLLCIKTNFFFFIFALFLLHFVQIVAKLLVNLLHGYTYFGVEQLDSGMLTFIC